LRIVVFGAGAIGSLFGGFLARDHEVTLVCREPRAQAIAKNGLAIKGLSDIKVHPKAVCTAAGVEHPDILFLTVKAYDTESAMKDIKELVAEDTIIVSLQNGLGNMETIAAAFPDSKLVMAITSQGAILRSPGIVEHTGKSYTIVGDLTDGFNAARIFDLLETSGIETDVSKDIQAEIWYKAIVNSVINPISTLLKGRNSVIIERPELQKLVSAIAAEGVEVARARGIEIDAVLALSKVMQVATETANNICSMRMDAEKGRKTEIMQMNGAIAGYGREAGVPTPVNGLLTALVRAMEPGKA
jgi:2-dehydropantoate 2-reductase